MELDTRIPAPAVRPRKTGRPYPTFALAFTIFDDPSWDALSAERPLRYWRLVEINQPGATPLTTSALRADERIVNYLKGLNRLDDRLTSCSPPSISPRGRDRSIPFPQQRRRAHRTRPQTRGSRQQAAGDPVHRHGFGQQTAGALRLFLSLGLPGFRLPASFSHSGRRSRNPCAALATGERPPSPGPIC